MKAFLSYSSFDKEFVTAVGRELGRQFCVYDAQAFSTGEDFVRSIEADLDEASVFTLFASKASLASIWVDFEIDQAWVRKLSRSLVSALVYLIDSSIEYKDLPPWLTRVLVRRENSPKLVARDIRSHMDHLLAARPHLYFVGRHTEIAEVEAALTPVDGSPPPRALSIAGLPGIGRRSLVRRTFPSLLNLKKTVEIRVGEGDSINDIATLIADLVEPYSTQEGLERIVQLIQALTEEQALSRALSGLRTMAGSQELPILIDAGGLLDDDGYYTPPIRSILRSMNPDDEAYIAIVTTRRPLGNPSEMPPHVHLRPLSMEDGRRLLSVLSSRSQLPITPSQLSELAEYVAGYPPAAHFAVQQAVHYGLEALIANKQRLVQFRTSVFLRHLSRITLSTQEQQLLRVLAFYSPLPLPVLAEIASLTPALLAEYLMRLIDLALITVSPEGYYSIADPIATAAASTLGFPDIQVHRSLARLLSRYLQTPDPPPARLQLSRVLFRVARIGGDAEIANAAVHLANDLIVVTETLYHARQYSDAIEAAKVALAERPDSHKSRDFLVRALIQEERWQEAEAELQRHKSQAPLRDSLFLEGFLNRKRHRLAEAVSAYENSIKAGRRGIAISRELGLCYLILGDIPKAEKHISEALRRQPDNPFLLDLHAQIAIVQKDEVSARATLGQLELVSSSFYFHRLSRLELALGNLPEAEAAAEQAVDVDARPPFSSLAQLAQCKLIQDKLSEGEALLQQIDHRFAHTNHDIRIGLRCRFNIRSGKYRRALELSEQFTDKNRLVHKAIRRDAIAGELRTSALTDLQRKSYEEELSGLEGALGQASGDDLLSSQIDSAL